MEKILTFGLICPFWTSFRNPSTVNVHVTYPFPPLTTLYGMLNAARGMPQDWHDDRDEWQISLVVERSGQLIETFSKILKIYEEKRGKAEVAEDRYGKAVFDRTTVMRQKMIGVHYTVYLKSVETQLIQAQRALLSPQWPLYLGESDDLVDVLSPRIIDIEPILARRIHSILPGLAEGCRLVKVPYRFVRLGKIWNVEQRLYSIPPEGEGIELDEGRSAYSIEGRNVIFDERNNHSG